MPPPAALLDTGTRPLEGRSADKVLALTVVIFMVTVVPLAVSVWLTSELTDVGPRVYAALNKGVPDAWLEAGLAMAFAGHLLDVTRWRGWLKVLSGLFIFVTGVCLLVGLLLMTKTAPCIPIIIGTLLSLLSLAAMQWWSPLGPMTVSDFSFSTSLAFLAFSISLAAIWLLSVGGSPNSSVPIVRAPGGVGDDLLTSWVLWASPLLYSIACLLVALFAMLRCRFHAHRAGIPASVGEEANAYDLGETKLVLACLGLVGLAAWVAASVAAMDMGLSHFVLRFTAGIGVCLVCYSLCNIGGLEQMEKAVQDLRAVALVHELLQSDWVRGIFLLFFLPILPFYFGSEVLHQFLRLSLARLGILEATEEESSGYFTEAAACHWRTLSTWNISSVLEKCMICGVLYFMLQVGIAQGVTLLLSAFAEFTVDWPLPTIMVMLYIVSLVMFLLPPVPGLPLYLLAGVLTVQRCEANTGSFVSGCLLAIALSLFMKLSGVLLQQKGIGSLFCQSAKVKRMCRLHTPTMKAVRHILRERGWSCAKVAVLVGGPDWPTSVLTGILDLPALGMLAGSLPVVGLIVPVVLTGAFKVRAGNSWGNHGFYRGVSNVCLVLSSLVMLACNIIAAYYVDRVQRENQGRIDAGDWEQDPQEAEVLRLVAQEEELASRFQAHIRWPRLPLWMRGLLAVGGTLMSVMMHIVLWPGTQPFQDFAVTDRIADLPGRSALGLVNPSGWVAIAFFVCGTFCLLVFEVQCNAVLKASSDESAALLSDSKSQA
mmetsp:Transcript_7617/g.15893  ORF Transcript_7617/g.15893 Transcript_7617/m.15893 type:complete len:767 (-) Transcript_7617:167-2467(-)